jgi:hypothetical protein
MLEPHELAAAMSISTPEAPYHFTGNKTQVVKQIGQAISLQDRTTGESASPDSLHNLWVGASRHRKRAHSREFDDRSSHRLISIPQGRVCGEVAQQSRSSSVA